MHVDTQTAETDIYGGLCLGPHAGTAGLGQACMLTWVCEAIVRTREHMAKSCGNVAELEGRGTQSSGLPT